MYCIQCLNTYKLKPTLAHTMFSFHSSFSEIFFNFLEPFTTNLWILCVGCYIVYSLIFYLICWANTCLLKTRNGLISLGQSLSFFGTAFIQQESEYKPSSFGEVLLSVIWRVFAILILATYTANLVRIP